MNIEESCMETAILKRIRRGNDFHISDNNRRFPGYGALDFYRILKILKSGDYDGVITVEGITSENLLNDIGRTSSYLADVSMRLNDME